MLTVLVWNLYDGDLTIFLGKSANHKQIIRDNDELMVTFVNLSVKFLYHYYEIFKPD